MLCWLYNWHLFCCICVVLAVQLALVLLYLCCVGCTIGTCTVVFVLCWLYNWHLCCCICVVLAVQLALVLLNLHVNKHLLNWTELNLIEFRLLIEVTVVVFLPPRCNSPPSSGPWPPDYPGFTITLRHTTLGRTPLDEWSARRTDPYLTALKRKTSVPPVGFEPAIPGSERSQTHVLDRAATGIGSSISSSSSSNVGGGG